MSAAASPVPADAAPWVVIKFGGTSVSTRPRWENIARIAAAHRARGRRVLVVVSALSGVTDLLKRIAESGADESVARAAQVDIVARHNALLADLELPLRNALEGWLARLDQLIADPRRATRALDWQASNRGRRLDHMWASPDLAAQSVSHRFVEATRRWDQPSDHVPLITEFAL